MRRASLLMIPAALLLAAAPAPPAAAQEQTAQAVRLKSKTPKVKVEKFKGQVLAHNVVQIIVQSRENTAFVRTFTYAPQLEEKMQKLIERGGYQPGDTVEVHFEAGTDVAVRIKGKPSKPL